MEDEQKRLQRIKNGIGCINDFPKKGIVFRDVFPLMREPSLFADCIDLMATHLQTSFDHIDVIVGLDARGFIFAPLISSKLGVAFVPIRKKGKLPGETIQQEYSLEYGTDTFEVQKDALKHGQKVVIVDDLLATGGTLDAACKLVKSCGADVLEALILIELIDLKGRKKVQGKVHSMLTFEGE